MVWITMDMPDTTNHCTDRNENIRKLKLTFVGKFVVRKQKFDTINLRLLCIISSKKKTATIKFKQIAVAWNGSEFNNSYKYVD